MPQRTFWATQHEVKLLVTFELDPMNPGGPPKMLAAIYDQAGQLVMGRHYFLPPTCAEMAWYEASMTFLNTWMLADAEAAHKAMRRDVEVWWRHEEDVAQSR